MAIADQPTTVPTDLRLAQQRILRRLEIVRRRLRWHLLVEGVFWVVVACLAVVSVTLALDWQLRLNLPARLVIAVLAAGGILWVAIRRLIRPLLLPLNDLDLAELLDRRSPGVGQRISNVLQLPELLAHGDYASPTLVHAAVLECAQALDQVDLNATLNIERRHKLLAACGGFLLLAVVLTALWPQVASLWARRWLAGSTLRWPQQTYLSVVGLGDDATLLVPRGEMSLLQIDAAPKFVATDGGWTLHGRDEPLLVEGDKPPSSQAPEQVGIAYSGADGTSRRGSAVEFGAASFRYELPPLAEPIDVHLTGGDDWLGPIRIEPVDRPTVVSLEITALTPGRSEPTTEKIGDGTTQLLYLPQTKLTLKLVASAPLVSAEAFDKGTRLANWQRVDQRTYTLEWTMQESLALEFRLIGERGGLASKPYFLAIGLLKDREPRVAIQAKGVGRRITPMARLPLAMRVNDDFGVATVALDWERTALVEEKASVDTKHIDLQVAPVDANEPPRMQIDFDHELTLADQKVAPGNTLKLRATATDACALGAQSGHSRWLQFQVVTPDELFYEILMRQREQRAKFGTALESAKAQAQALTECTKGEEAVAISRAHQVIARAVWQNTNQLDASLVEMTLNDLGNAQMRENMQTAIISPLRSLHGDVLARLRTAVDAMAQQPKVADDQRAEAVAVSDQAVEIMQGILAQMSLWESFVDVIKQLEHVISNQGKVLNESEEMDKKRTDELFKED